MPPSRPSRSARRIVLLASLLPFVTLGGGMALVACADSKTSGTTETIPQAPSGDGFVRSVGSAKGTASPPKRRSENPDVQQLAFRYGPIRVESGQNFNVLIPRGIPGPKEDGFITRFQYTMKRADGSIPSVTQLHFHHGVFGTQGSEGSVLFPGGEEKSIFQVPEGFGWQVKATDFWFLNHMIHNLYPGTDDVYLEWQMDFVPAASATGKRTRPAATLWMDVEAEKNYPVFDAIRGDGKDGTLVYPDDQPRAYDGETPRNQVTVPVDGVLVQTVGHIHPGGKWTDLTLTRDGRTVNLFRSKARYFDPRGGISWDMAMEATGPDWKVQVKQGDVLSISTTYETKDASWYEAMGLAAIAFAPGAGGVDPFTGDLDRRGRLTHGRLPENIDTPTKAGILPDPATLPDGPTVEQSDPIGISQFVYSQGDLSQRGEKGRPPVVRTGTGLTFRNDDARKNIFHTITSCKLPCNGSPGIGYPLADDGPAIFDSGELGFGDKEWTAAANRDTWTTPKDLSPGTYAYFCRIHPFMRGSFRVADR